MIKFATSCTIHGYQLELSKGALTLCNRIRPYVRAHQPTPHTNFASCMAESNHILRRLHQLVLIVGRGAGLTAAGRFGPLLWLIFGPCHLPWITTFCISNHVNLSPDQRCVDARLFIACCPTAYQLWIHRGLESSMCCHYIFITWNCQ